VTSVIFLFSIINIFDKINNIQYMKPIGKEPCDGKLYIYSSVKIIQINTIFT